MIAFLPGLLSGLWLPFLAAALIAGLIRLVGGPGRGARLADVAVGTAFLLTFLAWSSGVPFFARTAHALVGEAAATGLAIGVTLTLAGAGRRLLRVAAVMAPLALLWWRDGIDFWRLPWRDLVAPMVLTLGGMAVLLRLAASSARGPAPLVLLTGAALGFAGVAACFGATDSARLGLALAAALAGFLAWNWPVPRWPLGPAGWFAAGGALLALAATLGQGFRTLFPLALLSLVFFVEPAATAFTPSGGALRRALAPPLLLLVAAVPVIAAIGAALLLAWLY